MTVVLAIDPGPERSAYVAFGAETIVGRGLLDNAELLTMLRAEAWSYPPRTVVIEKVESFGMSVGAEVFETVFWSGQFAEAAQSRGVIVDRIGRKAVKIHLCGSMRAKDGNIRAALLDRFGPGKEIAVGLKRSPGPLYGIAGDVWSALAVAVTWSDQHA